MTNIPIKYPKNISFWCDATLKDLICNEADKQDTTKSRIIREFLKDALIKEGKNDRKR